jgi:hypothetical protein
MEIDGQKTFFFSTHFLACVLVGAGIAQSV